LADQPRGARAEVEVLKIDFLALEASVRYLGLLHSAETSAAETDLDDQEIIESQGIEQRVEVGDDAKPNSTQ
jgi:exoribonuclease-2